MLGNFCNGVLSGVISNNESEFVLDYDLIARDGFENNRIRVQKFRGTVVLKFFEDRWYIDNMTVEKKLGNTLNSKIYKEVKSVTEKLWLRYNPSGFLKSWNMGLCEASRPKRIS